MRNTSGLVKKIRFLSNNTVQNDEKNDLNSKFNQSHSPIKSKSVAGASVGSSNFPVVGLGASAGGLELLELFVVRHNPHWVAN